MMMVFILLTAFLGFDIGAAELDKVSKDRGQLLISPEMGERIRVGDRVCVEGANWKKICGTVTRNKGSKSVAKMDALVEGMRRGDRVTIESTKGSMDEREESDWGRGDWDREQNRDREENRYGRLAQKERGTGFLLRGGIVSSGTYPNPTFSDPKFKIKVTGGVGFNVPLSSNTWSFEPSLNYNSKGVESENEGYGGPANYLELPLLFKVRFLEDSWSPVFLLGPYVAYLMSASTSTSSVTDFDVKDLVKDYDIGLMTGLGFDFDISSSSRLGFHFYASWGFVDLPNEGSSFGQNGSASRNKQVGFLMNLYFDL